MADPLTPDQVPAVIARLARLEQEERERHRNIMESVERCKRIAAQATHPKKADYYQSEAERDEPHAVDAQADADALALAQQALREWVSVGVAIQALERARKAFPDSVAAGPDGSGYAYAWDELTGDEQEWVKDEVLALLDTLEQLKGPRTVRSLKLEDPADAD